ncbi:DUF2141 domain-containing protein [Pseudoduganella plicata]|uniref:DUF2141 domain-containing protein n=1 Tax=Pseudoduganella plicata TaxID=321984 RepID=A0AA87Y8Y4_9BURK|nr:DUF2141 domain-containing protein [Pseudoduganella plicata]GGY78001.1 hypothetical protein GCM10007388_08540 [Pseudoduganella plicata]
MKQYVRFAIVATFASAAMARASDLTVDVQGLKDGKGTVLVGVYDRAGDFLKKPMRTSAAAARPDKVRVVIAGLPAGEYALSAFKDDNGNGKLDVNPAGMPIEPYGFSNDAAGSYGPPSYRASLVHLPEGGGSTTITLR